jgi:hypothetical protein
METLMEVGSLQAGMGNGFTHSVIDGWPLSLYNDGLSLALEE